jgi:hypothetical protein
LTESNRKRSKAGDPNDFSDIWCSATGNSWVIPRSPQVSVFERAKLVRTSVHDLAESAHGGGEHCTNLGR